MIKNRKRRACVEARFTEAYFVFKIGIICIVGGAKSTHRGGAAIKINLVKVDTVTLKSVFSFS